MKITIKELLRGQLLTENSKSKNTVRYSGVILDNKSHEILLNIFKDIIPENWNKYAHHMTIAVNKPVQDETELGKVVPLNVTHLGMDDMVIAVIVEGYPTTKDIPHVTIATNPIGGKPHMSNKLSNWEPIENFTIYGTVENIKN